MDITIYCHFQDIQEDTVKRTTKFICSEPDTGYIDRYFNKTTYPYRVTGTFELPSRHLVLNAIEEHEQTIFPFDGHLVFKNREGKIEVN